MIFVAAKVHNKSQKALSGFKKGSNVSDFFSFIISEMAFRTNTEAIPKGFLRTVYIFGKHL
ncbi:MAG: hypothetical protein Q4E71_08660, partial [Prevotella sp.]|nr:hypothetical protein [Prevotella sp.]